MTSELETERLVIRPFLPADFDELYRLLYSDEEVARRWTGRSRERQGAWNRFATEPVWRLTDGFGFRAVARKEDGALLGLCGFQRFEPDEDLGYVEVPPNVRPIGMAAGEVEAELTYALGREYHHHGYANEACRAMLRHGFEELGIARVVNIVDERNTGSVALMKRLGFEIVPNLRSRPGWPSIVGILESPENS